MYNIDMKPLERFIRNRMLTHLGISPSDLREMLADPEFIGEQKQRVKQGYDLLQIVVTGVIEGHHPYLTDFLGETSELAGMSLRELLLRARHEIFESPSGSIQFTVMDPLTSKPDSRASVTVFELPDKPGRHVLSVCMYRDMYQDFPDPEALTPQEVQHLAGTVILAELSYLTARSQGKGFMPKYEVLKADPVNFL